VRSVLMTGRSGLMEPGLSKMPDGELLGRVYRHARCADSNVDPDTWFPLAVDVTKAREQAADAIAVCVCCTVRADCLELSLRRASDLGAYGVWGGLVEGERQLLRRRWLGGASVTEFLERSR
jgi:Transcription factor WhiB